MEKKELVKTIKQVATLVVGVGVGLIAGHAVKAVTPSDMGALKKLCVGAGSLAIGMMAQDKVTDYVEEQIDNAVEMVEDSDETAEESTDELELAEA